MVIKPKLFLKGGSPELGKDLLARKTLVPFSWEGFNLIGSKPGEPWLEGLLGTNQAIPLFLGTIWFPIFYFQALFPILGFKGSFNRILGLKLKLYWS